MSALIEVILPVFLVMGFGYLVVTLRLFGHDAVEALMRFAQSFAVPVLLFRGVARLDLAHVFDPHLLLSFYLGVFAGFCLGALGARVLFKRSLADCVAIGFCCAFSNTLLLGLPITERAYGAGALAGNYAIISLHAPLIYGLGIAVMEMVRHSGQGLALRQIARKIFSGILTNPLVIGIALGFVVNLLAVPLPAPIWAAVDMMAAAAIPAALFGLGGVLVRYRPEGDLRAVFMVAVISLICHPTITWVLGTQVFSLTTAQLRSAVVTAAMAPGVNAYLFANMYGSARRVAASSVLVATALSILTAWFWLSILP
jgi:malonate transporter and related proteins